MNGINFRRRQLSLALAASPWAGAVLAQPSNVEGPYVEALKRGNCMVLIRHAITVPGIGDPPGMRLDDCSTQRDLSEEGRAQSRRFGQWFRKHGLMPARVRSSQWCRRSLATHLDDRSELFCGPDWLYDFDGGVC